ncbi:MAG: ApeI family dehydratase [Candidatus Binataceae bacterium]
MSDAAARAPESPTQSPEIAGFTRSRERVELNLIIPESLIYFRGHFPNFAILPGVVQLDWAVHYGKQYFAPGAYGPDSVRIKFNKPIRPNHRVTLTLKYVQTRSSIQFEYADADGACSSGQIGFAPA